MVRPCVEAEFERQVRHKRAKLQFLRMLGTGGSGSDQIFVVGQRGLLDLECLHACWFLG